MTLSNAIVLAQNEATCTLNGEQVPCDEVKEAFGGFLLGFGILFVLMMLFALLSVAFMIWMIIDAAQRDFEDKLVWIILILFTGPIGAIAYYFAVKRKKDTAVNPQNAPSPTSHATERAPTQPKTQDTPTEEPDEPQPGNKESKTGN